MLAPVAITAYALYFIVSTIDSWIPIFTYTDDKGVVHVQNYGLGFVVIIVALIIIGYVSSFFITGQIVSFIDKNPAKDARYQTYLLHHPRFL